MRISHQPSGGRGEFEICEQTRNGISPHDILGHRIILDVCGAIQIDTNTNLLRVQGKNRLRRIADKGMQIPRQVIAAMLMPDTVRSDVPTGGGMPVLQKNRYLVDHIPVTSATLNGRQVILRVDSIIARNKTIEAEEVLLAPRLQLLAKVWQEHDKFPDPVADLLNRHHDLVTSGGPIPTEAERIVARLQMELASQAEDLGILYSEHADVLPALVQLLGLPVPEQPSVEVDEIEPEEIDLKRRTIKEWRRWAACRGPASAKFRRKVRKAYKSKCLVCGRAFPSTKANRVPGVDAAHIVPWSQFDMDRVDNGICLCKLHHWAFDEGLVWITCDEAGYHVTIPTSVREYLENEGSGFSIEMLTEVEGPIPHDRLPRVRSERPNPQLLTTLQQAFSQ